VGPNPARPGLTAIGTDIDPVPVAGLAANFSPIPRIAPPALGKVIAGGAIRANPGRSAPPSDGFRSISPGADGTPSFDRLFKRQPSRPQLPT
jgi:hypothetical protein